jgi:integrase
VTNAAPTNPTAQRIIRCAVYTRKSTEEGFRDDLLDPVFLTLPAEGTLAPPSHVLRPVARTLAELGAWKAQRVQDGAGEHDPFACSVQSHRRGESIQRAAIRRRFLTACKVLGSDRLRKLTIHHGRHTFISHALAGGRTLPEVRAAAGHSNVAVTSAYLHIVVDDREPIGSLFLYS